MICGQNLFQKIEFFVVKPPTIISDHSQIVTWLNSNTNTSHSANNGNALDFQTLEKLPTQFVWNYNSDSLFTEALMSQQTQELIGDFMNCDFPSSETGVDEGVQSLENILCNAASQSLKRGKIKRRSKITNTVTKKWFDKECRLKRHAVRKLANAKHRDPTNIDIRKLFHQRLKENQLLVKSKQNKYKLEKRKELEEAAEITDLSSFWSTLKSMPDTLEKKQIPPISQEDWLEHFKNLHDVPAKIKNPEQQDIKRESENIEKNKLSHR